MEVTVCIRRSIIIDNDINALDVDTTAKDVRCDEYTFLKYLESSVSFDSDGEMLVIA